MRLPIIKSTVNFVNNNDIDYIHETLDVLEMLCDANGINDIELDVIGELMSNLYGAIEVQHMINDGKTQKEALNEFMKRVQNAINK
jgi:hypothetical protein